MSLRRKPPAGTVQRPRIKGLNIRGQMTNKANRIVGFESESEHLLLLRLDRDPLVRDYATRLERITYRNEHGILQMLIPDMLVWRTSGTIELHVITTARDSQQTTAGQSVAATQGVCHQRSWQYISHVRGDLSNKTEFANLQALFLYRPAAYAQPSIGDALENALANNSCTLLDLIEQVRVRTKLAPSIVRGAICHLIWHGKLGIDLAQLLIVRGVIAPSATIWLA